MCLQHTLNISNLYVQILSFSVSGSIGTRVRDSKMEVKSLVLQQKERQYTVEFGQWIQSDIYVNYPCLCGSPHTHSHYSDFNIRNQTCNKISLLTIGTIIIDLFPSSVAK